MRGSSPRLNALGHVALRSIDHTPASDTSDLHWKCAPNDTCSFMMTHPTGTLQTHPHTIILIGPTLGRLASTPHTKERRIICGLCLKLTLCLTYFTSCWKVLLPMQLLHELWKFYTFTDMLTLLLCAEEESINWLVSDTLSLTYTHVQMYNSPQVLKYKEPLIQGLSAIGHDGGLLFQ